VWPGAGFDVNGLFLALVDPRRLLDFENPDLVTAEELADLASWSIPLGRMLDTIRLAYDRPEPLVLTVNAGDCVQLTILNALIGRGEGRGLADAMGDPEMPRIVPLNVEPRWSSGTPVNPAIGEASPLHNQPLVYTQEDDIALRPSSRLALSLPLPVFNEMHSYGRPFGGNRTLALSGIGSDDPSTILSIDDRPGVTPKWTLRSR
jgi:manganese oxidase